MFLCLIIISKEFKIVIVDVDEKLRPTDKNIGQF